MEEFCLCKKPLGKNARLSYVRVQEKNVFFFSHVYYFLTHSFLMFNHLLDKLHNYTRDFFSFRVFVHIVVKY